ncbi:MAG: T9SS type A sorting domain-containing protein [Sphingobacteriales bacterium]|nr:MAG: T9SS type A sorting domain-containing protein [Sphingobacteriales bacterium]
MKKIYLVKHLLNACILLCLPFLSKAQYASATQYPFIANEEPFVYMSSGTTVSSIYQDDAQTTGIPIGFTFKFCNVDYTNVSVSSNGWMSFTSSTAFGSGICNDNRLLSQMATYNSLPGVFPFWDDLGFFIGGTATYKTDGVPGNQVFTFEWRGWTWDFAATPGTFSYQVKLYETGSIKFAYKREVGPISSDYTGTSGQAGWFGASIGIAGSTSDFQFLDGSTPDAVPTYSPGTFKTNIDARPFSNQSFMWLAPCNNATTINIVAPKVACKDRTFRLAAVSEPLGIGSSCSWEYSDDGDTWHPIVAATGVISDMIQKPRWYRVKATCGGTVLGSVPLLVNVAPHYQCYCKSGATTLTNANGSAADIGSVVLETYPYNDTILITREPALNTTNNQYSVKGYTDFRRDFTPIVMYRDSTYRTTVQGINWRNLGASNMAVYLDYNMNGVYEAWEKMMGGPASIIPPVPFGALRDTFVVPDTAKIGITGMRIVMRTAGVADVCNAFADGEVEDYLVNISYPPCDGVPDAGTVKISDTNMCIGYDYYVIDTSYEKLKTNITRVWQASADQVTWSDVAGSANKDSVVKIFAGQPTYHRLRSVCNNTHDTAYTNTVFINSKPTYKCYCHSQSMGGATDTSDVGGFGIATFSVNDGSAHLENTKAFRKHQDRTDLAPVQLDVDSTYEFFVYQAQPNKIHADAKITIFVDFNNNKQYDIPSERIYTGFTTVTQFTKLGTVVIPGTVITDVPTGMRVIVNNDVSPNAPSDEACGEYISGETEDYIVTFHRNFPVTVGNLPSLSNMAVYPNPTTGRFTLGFNAAAAQVNVVVKNVTGQQVYTHTFSHEGGSFNQQIDLSNYAKGIYMVEVSGAGAKAVQKVVLQ